MASNRPQPRLGLGCASLGTPAPALSDRDAEAVIAAAWERGIRFFDVAPLYGGGVAEERLGRALAGRPRNDYVLCTKTGVTRPYASLPMPPGGTRRRELDRWDYSAVATRASVKTSLRRLRTDRLDIVHLHDTEDHPEACLEAYAELARLRDARVVVAIGIGSNVPAAVRALVDRAVFTTFLLAGAYTLLDQSGAALLDDAHARGIRVIIGGVFNSGVLARWPHPAPTFAYQPAEREVLERTARIAAMRAVRSWIARSAGWYAKVGDGCGQRASTPELNTPPTTTRMPRACASSSSAAPDWSSSVQAPASRNVVKTARSISARTAAGTFEPMPIATTTRASRSRASSAYASRHASG